MNITINVIKLSNIVDKDFEFQWAQDFQNNLLKGNQKSPRTQTHTPRDLQVKVPHFAQKPNSSVERVINRNILKTLKQQDHNLCSFSTLQISEKENESGLKN
jgi:hypothetical protein